MHRRPVHLVYGYQDQPSREGHFYVNSDPQPRKFQRTIPVYFYFPPLLRKLCGQHPKSRVGGCLPSGRGARNSPRPAAIIHSLPDAAVSSFPPKRLPVDRCMDSWSTLSIWILAAEKPPAPRSPVGAISKIIGAIFSITRVPQASGL